MVDVNKALKVIRSNQIFFLAPYIDNRAVKDWIMTKGNTGYISAVADITYSLLWFLKPTGQMTQSSGTSKAFFRPLQSVFSNIPEVKERAFVSALIGAGAAERFFRRVYPAYQTKKLMTESDEPLPINYEELGRFLESNLNLCSCIEELGKNDTVKELNKNLPQGIVPVELITQNRDAQMPRFLSPEPPNFFSSVYASPRLRTSTGFGKSYSRGFSSVRDAFQALHPSGSFAESSASSVEHFMKSSVPLDGKKLILSLDPLVKFYATGEPVENIASFAKKLQAAKEATFGFDPEPEDDPLVSMVNEIIERNLKPHEEAEAAVSLEHLIGKMAFVFEDLNYTIPKGLKGQFLLELLAVLTNEAIDTSNFSAKLDDYQLDLGISFQNPGFVC